MNTDGTTLNGDYNDSYGADAQGGVELTYDDQLDAGDMSGVPPVVQPRVMQPSGGVSYANAHHAQRLQGQVQPLAPRKPQALKQAHHAAPQSAPAGAGGQQQAPAKPKLSNGQGTVKAVPTGDTVVVSFATGEAKTITLSGVQAPRVQRGPPRAGANDEKKASEEEPFGWESKEFLRKMLLGRIVSFQINHVAAGNREYGQVKVDDKNVAEAIVAAGWAKVKESAPRKDGKPHPERAGLGDLQAAAIEQGLGMHAKGVKAEDHTRKVDWNPNTRHLYDKFKGQVLNGTIDRVMDGSTLRVELQSTDPKKPLQHSVITLYLAGVQCPLVPMPPRQDRKPAAQKKAGDDADDEDDAEPAAAPAPRQQQPQQTRVAPPFAHEARAFVERLLLHRDVGAVIQGIDKAGRLFGSIVFHKGNISTELLKQGYATLVEWSAVLTSDPQALKDAERTAKAQRARIWSTRPVSHAQEESNDDDKSFTAKVVQVVSGDTIVAIDGNNRTRRLVLASIQAPRLGFAREQRESQPFAWEAKEYLRQRLVGRKVKITVEYKRNLPAQGGGREEPREYVTVYAGKNNASISEELLAAGLANVVRHRLDEPRSSAYDALIAAENQAQTRRVGLHDKNKKYSPPKYVDLTDKPRGDGKEEKGADAPKSSPRAASAGAGAAGAAATNTLSARAKMLLGTLQRDPDTKGVVEHVFSGTRIKVLIPKHEVFVSMLLAGIRCPAAPGANRNKKDDKGEPFGKEAIEFTRNAVLQQDVRLEVETMDKGDNFIGSVWVGKQNLAFMLLDEGLASVFSASADRSKYSKDFYEREAQAKQAKKNMWKNWVPPPPKPEEPAEDKTKETESKELSAEEQFLNVNLTEVVDGANFFVQIVGNQATTFIEEKMKAFAAEAEAYAPGKYEPEKGATCAARFSDGAWHRVKVETKTPDGFGVYFVDYGNHELVQAEDLRPITDRTITAVAPLARQCTLAGCRAPTTKTEWFGPSRDALQEYAYGHPMLAKVHFRDVQNRLHVTLHYADRPDSVNQLMLRDGLLRIAERPHPRLKNLVNELRAEEAHAKESHSCIWEYGDVSDEEDEAPAAGGPAGAKGGRPPRR